MMENKQVNEASAIYPSEDERVYKNQGNSPLIDLLSACSCVLDVGCGAGDNARLIRSRQSDCAVFGITHAESEARLARQVMEECWVLDLELAMMPTLGQHFDTLIFSHVLEHLKEPADVLKELLDFLKPGGCVLIAVPNVLCWRMRLQFLKGAFEYESAGVLDDTHIRFFTYFTADRYLLRKCPDLKLISKTTTGSFPLWILRRFLFPNAWCEWIDQLACRHWPNLFGSQILIKAIKQ